VRQDLDVSSLDSCAQKAVKWIGEKSAQLPSQELLSPPAQTGAMEDAISQFWNTPAMTAEQFVEKVVGVLKQQY
jgi:glucose/mannose transport system substrate-binding protein